MKRYSSKQCSSDRMRDDAVIKGGCADIGCSSKQYSSDRRRADAAIKWVCADVGHSGEHTHGSIVA